MSDKVENKMDAEAPSKIKSAESKDLHRLAGEAARDVSEILKAANNPQDNPEAHIDYDQAAKELDTPAGDLKERLHKRMKEVEDCNTELAGRYEGYRARKAAETDTSAFEIPHQYEGGAASGAHRVFGETMLDRMAANESAEFQREFKERASYKPSGGDVVIREEFANFNPRIFATSTKANTMDPQDNLDYGRMVVMYNDPFTPIHTRFDTIPVGANGDSYTYYKEVGAGGDGTAAANKVKAIAEEAAYPEQTLGSKKVTVNAEKIAAHVSVTDEQLEDVQQARAFIDTRLRRNFNQVLENNVVKGNGTSPNWDGLVSHSNIQTQAVGSSGNSARILFDVFIDAWQKLIGVAYVQPNLIAMPSAQAAALAKFKDQDKNYIWSNVVNGMPTQIIGIPVVYSEALTASTAIVLNTGEFAMLTKRGLTVEYGMTGDDFIMGRQTVRGSMRGNMIAWRENALINLTTLNNITEK